MEDRLAPATWDFIPTAAGTYDMANAGNWMLRGSNPPVNGLPGPADTAVIASQVITVTLSTPMAIGELDFAATLQVSSAGSLTLGAMNPLGTSGTLVNAGTITSTGGDTSFQIGVFNNSGTINAPSGTLLLAVRTPGSVNTGTLSVGDGATLQINDVTGALGGFNLNTGTMLVEAGTGVIAVVGGEVNLNVNQTLPRFQIVGASGGRTATLQGTGDLTVTNTMTMANGRLTTSGTTTIPVGATLNITGDNNNAELLANGTLETAGTTNWTGTAQIIVGNASTWNNRGAFNDAVDGLLNYAGGRFNNLGTFTKTNAASGTTTISSAGGGIAFANSGTLAVNSGTLVLAGIGSSTGVMNIASGTTLDFQVSSFEFKTGATVTGAGNVLFSSNVSSTITVSTNLTIPNLQLNAIVAGAGNLTVSNALIWLGGQLSLSGTTTVPAGATLTLSGNGDRLLTGGGTLNMAGTATWTGTGLLFLSPGTVWNNTASFNVQVDANIQAAGGRGTFNNSGTLTRTSPSGTGTMLIDAVFNNTGTATVSSGVLQLVDGGSNSATLSVAAGATLNFAGGTFALNTGAVFSGAGLVLISGGATVNVNTSVPASNVELDISSTLGGTGTLTVANAFTWTGGAIAGTNFTLVLPASSTLTISGNAEKFLNGGTLNIPGTANWTGAGNFTLIGGGIINVQAGGSLNIQNNQTLGGGGALSNAGTVTKSGTAGITTVGGGVAFSNNGGAVSVQTGTLSFLGDYTQNSGTTTVASGTTLSAGGTVRINGGILQGTGTVTGAVTNAGAVSPGTASPGTLTITGPYTQAAKGTLIIRIGGAVAGQFDVLNVLNSAAFNGTLNVTLVNGFVPTSGTSFVVANYTSQTGNFITVNSPSSVRVVPAFNATNLTLTASGAISVPTITSFTPSTGQAGTSVTITGTNLTGATAVQFNGVAATTFTVDSSTQITAIVPAAATTGPIAVTTPGGTAVSAASFTVAQPATGIFVTAPDAGGAPLVKVFDANNPNGPPKFQFFAFDQKFTGGVRVAVGDVNGDGFPDIITAAGPGGGPDVSVFSGKDGSRLFHFFAYDQNFTGGVFVAAGDVNGDGFADIICGADAGGGPNVTVFSGKDQGQTRLASFFAYDPKFTGGVRVGAGDIDGDGHADIICGAGAGGGPNVTVFSGADPSVRLASFFAYDPGFTAGLYVAGGDVNGDGHADIICGAGAGGGPNITVFSGDGFGRLSSFFPFDPGFSGGVRVGAVNLNGDSRASVIATPGPGGGPDVRLVNGLTGTQIADFFAYDPAFTGGLYVAGQAH